jgi:hypothetical protein
MTAWSGRIWVLHRHATEGNPVGGREELMLGHHRAREDDRDHPGTLEVFDVRVVDEPPPGHVDQAPRACRWHLWHRWERRWADTHATYVCCAACGRLPAATLFEPPVP